MSEETGVTASETTEGQEAPLPRKPRVALMGEFSAGKSTLSNMLLGEAPFPTRITATRLPPVWASHGEKAAFAVDHEGQEAPLDLDELAGVSPDDTALIRLQRPADILQICDLIDMPGVSDPNMPAEAWLSMIDEIDMVIWCTHATQAWRQSEAAIWERIAPQTNGRNILLVTQFDKIVSERDRARVMSRVTKETRGQFEAVFPVSLLRAVEAGDAFDLDEEPGTAAFVEHFIETLLSPSAPAKKQPVDWETVPELPRGGDAPGAARPVSARPLRAGEPEAEAEAEAARPAPVPIMPKRVRPASATPRPQRPTRADAAGETAHG